METWGCEFLDDGCFKSPFLFKEPIYDPLVMLVPIQLVESMASKQRLSEVRLQDAAQIYGLMSSISLVGLQEPIEIRYTPSSIYLKDGHHRFTACKNLGWTEIPAVLVKGGKKPTYGITSTAFIERTMDEFRKRS